MDRQMQMDLHDTIIKTSLSSVVVGNVLEDYRNLVTRTSGFLRFMRVAALEKNKELMAKRAQKRLDKTCKRLGVSDISELIGMVDSEPLSSWLKATLSSSLTPEK